jgi:hypothetical protein
MKSSGKEFLEKLVTRPPALYRLWLLQDKPSFRLAVVLLRSGRSKPIDAIESLVQNSKALSDEERRVVERKLSCLFTDEEVQVVKNYCTNELIRREAAGEIDPVDPEWFRDELRVERLKLPLDAILANLDDPESEDCFEVMPGLSFPVLGRTREPDGRASRDELDLWSRIAEQMDGERTSHEDFVQTLINAFMADHFSVEDYLVGGAKINIEIGYQPCIETGANFVEDRIGNGTDFIEGGRIIGSNGYLNWKIVPARSKNRVVRLPRQSKRSNRPPYRPT